MTDEEEDTETFNNEHARTINSNDKNNDGVDDDDVVNTDHRQVRLCRVLLNVYKRFLVILF